MSDHQSLSNAFNLPKALPSEAQDQARAADIEIERLEARQREKEAQLLQKAEQALASGMPLLEFKRGFALNHFGNDEVYKAIVFAACLQSSMTTKGLQIYINGSKGSGKSSSLKAAIWLLPQTSVIDSSFSSKALYYEKIPEKTVVVIDDSNLKEEHVTLLKRCITNFQTETKHKTVINQKLVEQSIPRRLMWLGTSVMEEGDDQFRDRFMALSIRNSKLDDHDYVKWELERRGQGRMEIETNDDVELCRTMIQLIRDKEFIVEGVEKIKFSYVCDRRLINIFLDLVEASAILHYKQRSHTESEFNNIITVVPNQMDIQNALSFSFFDFLDESTEGRLTKAEKEMDEKLQEFIGTTTITREFTEAEIAKLCSKSVQAVRKLLYGKDGNHQKFESGLCSKTFWIRPGQSEHMDERNKNIITVDKHIGSMKSDFAWFDA